MRLPLLYLFLCLVIVACRNNGDQPGGRSHQTPLPDRILWPVGAGSAGDVITVEHGAMVGATLVTPTPDLVIGDGPSEVLGNIVGVTADAAGRIYIADGQADQILQFNSVGGFVRTIGRKGKGPGEFSTLHGNTTRRAGSSLALSHDTLFVLDERLHAFDTAGVYLGSSPVGKTFMTVTTLASTADGLILERVISGSAIEKTVEFALYDFSSRTETPGFRITEHYPDYQDDNRHPPMPLPHMLYAMSANSTIYIPAGDSFHIRAYSPSGMSRRSYISLVPRVRITQQDVEDYTESWLQYYMPELRSSSYRSETGNFEKKYRAAIGKRGRAEFGEAIGGIVASESGNLLINRTSRADRPYRWYGSSYEWVWLGKDGMPRLRLMLPREFVPRFIQSCRVYGTSFDADGTPLVIRYTLNLNEIGVC